MDNREMFEIQIFNRGQWRDDLISDYSEDNQFDTVDEAEAAMLAYLAESGTRSMQYRVMQINSE